jgi:hypothetical protein
MNSLTTESRLMQSEPQSYITTDGQSASLSWNKAPVWLLRPDLYYCQTFAGFLMWGTLSDKRTDPSFTISPGPRQSSHFRVRVQWDSWPYFTVSYSRFIFSSPPTTRRFTVEVFNPTSTWEWLNQLRVVPLWLWDEPNRDHNRQHFTLLCAY